MNKTFTRRSGRIDLSGAARIMPVLCMWLMIGIPAVFAEEAGQQITTPLMLSVENGTLREIFTDIEKQSAYVFIYSDEVGNMLSHKVTIHASKEPVEKILDRALAGSGLAYKVYERQIMISKQLPAADGDNRMQSVEEGLTIRGVVVDTKEPPQPLAGATVVVRGTTKGTITDESGFFSIKADRGDILLVSYTGYLPKEVRVNGPAANMSIALEQDVTMLEQIVVTGMSVQTRTKVASSVGIIESGNFTNKPITRMSQALQGGTTGIFVSQESGMPGGDGAKIKIRGVASLLGSDPLVLIDGVESDMDKLDPATVESVSILKDASAASMYGAKAGNGVIVITTKRGTAGRVSFSYNGYYGVQQPLYLPDFVDAAGYMEYHNVASVNSGNVPEFDPDTDIRITREGSDPINYPDTDWTKETMNSLTNIQEHTINVSGGNTTARFAFSAQYLRQEGIYKYMENGFERMSARLNTTINLTSNVFTYVDAYVNRDVHSEPKTTTRSLIDFIYRTPPNIAGVYPMKEGDNNVYYGDYQDVWNPVMNLQRGIREQYFKDYVTLNVRPVWYITPELALKGQFGYRLSSGLTRRMRRATQLLNYFTGNDIYSYAMLYETSYPSRQTLWSANLILDYNKTWNSGHELNVYGGWSQEGEQQGAWNSIGLISFFGKGLYSYKERYMLEVSVRGDGSSLFGKGHRWGVFPSVAAGWNIHNENFMQSARFISAMKLRLSYGMLGNNQINPFLYVSTVNSSGTEQSSGNPSITWEKVTILNAGLDLSLWSNRIDLTVDVFRKITNDLIVKSPATPSSAILDTYINAGQAQVDGFEIGLGYNHSFSRDVRMSVTVGYSYSKSILNKVANDRITTNDSRYSSIPYIHQKGYAIKEYYGYVADGLLSQQDIDERYPIIGGYNASTLAQQPGDIKYVDMNGDGVINDNDRVPIGSVDPNSVYYANLSLSWKNLDFEAQVNGVGKVALFYTDLISNPFDGSNGGKPQTWHLDYWTPENPDAKLPRPTLQAGNNGLFSTFWRQNGAYLRIRYIQIGYNIPALAQKMRGQNIRIYANVQNPFTFTGVNLIDPESKGTYSTYPLFRTYSIGLNLSF